MTHLAALPACLGSLGAVRLYVALLAAAVARDVPATLRCSCSVIPTAAIAVAASAVASLTAAAPSTCRVFLTSLVAS